MATHHAVNVADTNERFIAIREVCLGSLSCMKALAMTTKDIRQPRKGAAFLRI